jgi:pimeloyl-ACP methyl ester carboxylesterase
MTRTAAFVEREFSGVTPDAGFMWEDESFPLSRTYVDDLKAIDSTLDAVEAVTQPWLLIHGDADDLVPVQDGLDAFAVATCEKRWLEISGAGHSFDESSYPQLVEAVDEWLRGSFA